MIGAASRRRAALVVLAWCAALAALAVDAPLYVLGVATRSEPTERLTRGYQ